MATRGRRAGEWPPRSAPARRTAGARTRGNTRNHRHSPQTREAIAPTPALKWEILAGEYGITKLYTRIQLAIE